MPMRGGERGEDEDAAVSNAVSDEERAAFLRALAMTPEQIEEAERTPQRTPAWFAFRRDRLSASLFGSAAGHNAKNETPESVLRKMLWSQPFSNPATEYGTALEAAAFQAVEAGVAHDLQQRGFGAVWFEETGTRVCAEHPWMCASADGLIRAVGRRRPEGGPPESLRGVLELKAPYYKKAFYEPTPHYYYDQFSGQAHIHGVEFIVFGVYTPEAVQINYFRLDRDYWESELFPALRAFYMDKYLPRAILRDRGRIEYPNIDPHPCIRIDSLDFGPSERSRAHRLARIEEERARRRAKDEEEVRALADAAAAARDPWETAARA
jgi:hypothetical protein